MYIIKNNNNNNYFGVANDLIPIVLIWVLKFTVILDNLYIQSRVKNPTLKTIK